MRLFVICRIVLISNNMNSAIDNLHLPFHFDYRTLVIDRRPVAPLWNDSNQSIDLPYPYRTAFFLLSSTELSWSTDSPEVAPVEVISVIDVAWNTVGYGRISIEYYRGRHMNHASRIGRVLSDLREYGRGGIRYRLGGYRTSEWTGEVDGRCWMANETGSEASSFCKSTVWTICRWGSVVDRG